MEQNENTLSVLKIAPGQYPQQVEIDNNLKALQEAVGGTIAAVYPFADPVAIICNDDGKLMGLPLNRALRDENGEMYDAIAGDFLVVGLGEEDFASLTPELAQKYEQLFHQHLRLRIRPEKNGKIFVSAASVHMRLYIPDNFGDLFPLAFKHCILNRFSCLLVRLNLLLETFLITSDQTE